MYQVSIFNNGTETPIHVPMPDKEAPHILGGKYKGKLSQPDILSIFIPINNPGYSLIEGLNTKIKLIDTRDNGILFTGRVMPFKDQMDERGMFNGEFICEGALGYFNDTQTRRWNFTNKTPAEILESFLSHHNSIVDSSRQIHLGIVEITQPITIDTNYETVLNAIITKIRNVLGGDLRVQERNGVLYLDYLTTLGENNGVPVRLGANMKSITREYDPTDVITRAICQGYGEGINQLGIESVNNGLEYVEDTEAKAKYGVIEGMYVNKEIQNAYTLMQAGITSLNERKQPRLTLDTKMVDRSVLPQYNFEKHGLGDTLHILNSVFSIDLYARVIEEEIDIIYPQERNNVISTRPITLTDQIIDLKQRNQNLENAPQGNTVIFPQDKAENVDPSHPIIFDVDIPKETININRVYVHVHGRAYRLDGKETVSGGSLKTSSSNGSHRHKVFATSTSPAIGIEESYTASQDSVGTQTGVVLKVGYKTDIYTASANGTHQHEIDTTHIHTIKEGIVESTYPKDCYVKVNGSIVITQMGNGTNPFDYYDIDLTPYITVGNNKVEIGTYQNGRIEAVVYSQIFIQSR